MCGCETRMITNILHFAYSPGPSLNESGLFYYPSGENRSIYVSFLIFRVLLTYFCEKKTILYHYSLKFNGFGKLLTLNSHFVLQVYIIKSDSNTFIIQLKKYVSLLPKKY